MSMTIASSLVIFTTILALALAVALMSLMRLVRKSFLELKLRCDGFVITGPMIQEMFMDMKRRQKRRERKPKKEKARGERIESSTTDPT